MKCSVCGGPIPAGADACPDCGTPTGADPGAAAPTQQQLRALNVIEAVRTGSVPRNEVDLVTVGRERYLGALTADLPFIAAGGFKVRLVAGDLGFGKTHLLTLLSQKALQANFAISHVELHAREAPLERPETIVPAIMRNTTFPGGYSLEDHLRQWAQTNVLLDKREIEAWLQETAPSLEFRALVRAAMQISESGRTADVIVDIVRWLDGGAPTSALTAATGIRGVIRANTAVDIFTSFIRFAHATDTSGFVLLLDEAEAITSLAQANRRDEANQTLKRLLDNVEGRTHFEIVFATTTKFLEDESHGARSYPALWERLRTAIHGTAFNPHSTILRLIPLSRAELRRLGEKLAVLHGVAYGWKPTLQSGELDAIADTAYGKGKEGPPRRFVTALILVLDLMEADRRLGFAKALSDAMAMSK